MFRLHMSRSSLRALVLMVPGALALLALAGCAAPSLGAAPTATPTAQQIFDKAKNTHWKDAAFTLTASGTTSATGSAANIKMTGTGQTVTNPQANTVHITVDITGQGVNGTITIDGITVNGKAYTKSQINLPGLPSTGSDKYSVANASTSSLGSLSSLGQTNLSQVRVVGEETIRGDKCWHLEGVSSASGASTSATPAASATADVWVRKSDYYIVRIQAASAGDLGNLFGAAAGGASPNSTSNFSMTIDFSNFNSGVQISAPPASEIGS